MRLGIIGGGQLGLMLAEAASSLQITCSFYDQKAAAPVASIGDLQVGGFDDEALLRAFAESQDVLTYEFENIPASTVELLSAQKPTFPGSAVLRETQDRRKEKALFTELKIPTAKAAVIDSSAELEAAFSTLGGEAILKTARFGYDGKGQWRINKTTNLKTVAQELGERAAILEERIVFERELSIIAVRSRKGDCVFYPLVENAHHQGILATTIAPAEDVSASLQQTAEGYARRLLERFDYVGVLALELFQRGSELIANEVAPRVHNSGHWSIEGANCSQFENHVRAVCGLSLVPPELTGNAVMVNYISSVPSQHAKDATVHLYGKEPRPGRKLGHATKLFDSSESARRWAEEMRSQLFVD